jgi:hypothetical protein
MEELCSKYPSYIMYKQKIRRNTRSTLLKDNRKKDRPEQGLEWREFHDQGSCYIDRAG